MENDLHRPKIVCCFLKKSFKIILWVITSIPVLTAHYFILSVVLSVFFICNTWSNQCLKQAGLKASLWTPFDRGTLYHYRK